MRHLSRTLVLGFAIFSIGLIYGDRPAPAQTSQTTTRDSRADVLFQSGQAKFARADFKAALADWQQAATLYEASANTQGAGQAYVRLGQAYFQLDEYPRARESFERSLQIAEQLNDLPAQVEARIGLGDTCLMAQEFSKASALFKKSLEAAESLGNNQLKARAISRLGEVAIALGDHPLALAHLNRSLQLSTEAGDEETRAYSLSSLSYLHSRLGDYHKAIGLYSEALKIAEATGNRRRVAMAYANIGYNYRLLGDYAKALPYAEKSVELAGDIRYSRALALARGILGDIYAGLGAFPKAIALKQKALEAARLVNDQEATGIAYKGLGYTYFQMREFALASQNFESALSLFQQIGTRGREADVLSQLGESALAQSQPQAAQVYYRQALKLTQAEQSRNDFQSSAILNQLGLIQEQLGQLEPARQTFQAATAADPKNGIAANNFIRTGKLLARLIQAENELEANRYCKVAEQNASTFTLTQCAIGLLQTGSTDRALEFVTLSIARAQMSAELAYGWYVKGSILSALDLSRESERAFKKALTFKPPSSLMADIYLALGVLADDPVQLDRARKIDPSISQVSSVADLGGRSRRVRLAVRGEGQDSLSVQEAYIPPIYRRLLINGKPVLLIVDTGASYTLLNEESRRRVNLAPTAEKLLVAYADGRQEQLVRYRPQSVQLTGSKPKVLKSAWMLGYRGKDNLLGRDLLVQMMSPGWFRATQGK